MKNAIIAVLLISLMSLQIGAQLMIYAWYFKNYNFIATELCTNVDLPELKCDGKCILAQKLRMFETDPLVSEQENRTSSPDLRIKPILGVAPLAFDGNTLSNNIFSIKPVALSWISPRLLVTDIFHPPRFTA